MLHNPRMFGSFTVTFAQGKLNVHSEMKDEISCRHADAEI